MFKKIITLCITISISLLPAIALILLQRSGMGTIKITTIFLVLEAAFGIIVTLYVSWDWIGNGKSRPQFIVRFLSIIILVLFLVSVFGILIWPKPSQLFIQNFPGISFHALFKLNDVNANRRKYIIDFGHVNGSRFSVYVSSDNVFTFSFVDAKGEPHPIQLPVGSSGTPFGQFFYLICEIGIDGQSTVFRMVINGNEIKAIQLPFKVDLGSIDLPGGVIGADLNGKNGASFDLGTMMIFKTTMISSQITILTKLVSDYYQFPCRQIIKFSGNQWLRVNKAGFSNPIQSSKMYAMYDANAAIKITDRNTNEKKFIIPEMLQPETYAYINRVLADGGIIVDILWIDVLIRTLKSQDLYP